MQPKQIAIIGGGPAGLMAADVLSPFHQVRVYEKEKAIGQKFLVAGTGGVKYYQWVNRRNPGCRIYTCRFFKGSYL